MIWVISNSRSVDTIILPSPVKKSRYILYLSLICIITNTDFHEKPEFLWPVSKHDILTLRSE